MKLPQILAISLVCGGWASGQAGGSYTNFIRQVEMPSGVQWDASVEASGEQNSMLPIDLGGARFELWTVLSSPLTSYLLDTRFVAAYLPTAEVTIQSEDPYTVIPRTRADRPFQVDVTISGLLSGPTDPDASKAVKLLRHVQSYAEKGSGENLDRSQAALESQVLLHQNGTQTLSFPLTSISGADRTKVRGEERFSVFSLAADQAPESQLASQTIQIWPVADATISGISPNQKIRLELPKLTLTLNDLYPDSRTYAQVYRGSQRLGEEGILVPGSSLILNEVRATDRVLLLDDYESVFDGDGVWTMEILTATPFGIDRLAYVTFEIDRTLELQGTFTTME
jgi:hypothetical protein